MKLSKKIQKRFAFLVNSNGYTYTQDSKGSVYTTCFFNNGATTIIISYDFRNDYLDMSIKRAAKVFMETCYGNVTFGEDVPPDVLLSQRIAAIYSTLPQKIILSKNQFDELIELYAEFITRNLKRFE